jgi:tetratricopeptide (TPR) repeat protein
MTPAMESTSAEKTWYVLEQRQVFSRSLIWDLQEHYFAARGVDAWRQGEVPHYITSNPTIANSYVEIVLACLREHERLAGVERSREPLYICELGGGSGRFAFYFLKQLMRLSDQARLTPPPFRYILTDFTQSNLDYWRSHPHFQTFFDAGVLDLALFDINESNQLTLQVSGQTINAGSLHRPIVVIANYVFDSIPQDLFYFASQECQQCLVTLLANEDPDTFSPAELLAHLSYHYDYQALSETPYDEPHLQELLAGYQDTLSETHLLFPGAGLRCLERFRSFSETGVMLLSADKGDHRLAALHRNPPPQLVYHGSFSLSVNYHAFKLFCEQIGGVALFPDNHHESINVSCLLMLKSAASYVETQRAYQRHVQDFSPDDFFTIARHAGQHITEMSAADILAYLRLSYYDGAQFTHYLPRLTELTPGLSHDERQAVVDAVDKVWELYFPLGEEVDLAYQIAGLFYQMEDYARALIYFEHSIEIYGQHTGTLFNMAACHQMDGRPADAHSLLRQVLRYDPDNQQARELLAAGAAPA